MTSPTEALSVGFVNGSWIFYAFNVFSTVQLCLASTARAISVINLKQLATRDERISTSIPDSIEIFQLRLHLRSVFFMNRNFIKSCHASMQQTSERDSSPTLLFLRLRKLSRAFPFLFDCLLRHDINQRITFAWRTCKVHKINFICETCHPGNKRFNIMW